MTEAEFWASTPRYFFAMCDAVEAERLERMEETRLLAFYMVKTVDTKNRIKTPRDLFRLPTESEPPTAAEMWKQIDPAAMDRFNKFADTALAAKWQNGDNSRP